MKRKITFITVLLTVLITGTVYCFTVKPFEEEVVHDLFEVKERITPAASVSDAEDKADIISGSIEEITDSSQEHSIDDTADSTESKDVTTVIYVHVCGAVAESGVYGLAKDSRVLDAIEASGGFSDGAAEDYINLAGKLSDGQRLYIPFLDELTVTDVTARLTGVPIAGEASQLTDTRIVNINTASQEELMRLPGIGASRAQSIIDYRLQNGRFKVIEDIMKVAGIKEAMYDNLKDYITVD